jgi:SAM-dependent methyltransferase
MSSLVEWNDYWRNNGDVQSLYSDKNGKPFKEFSFFWNSALPGTKRDLKILDIACGTGALFKSLNDVCFDTIAGLDCSEVALGSFNKNFPQAKTFLTNGTKLPKNIVKTFDVIVSQFGIEYLGKNAVVDVLNSLKPNAEFIALCHFKGGHIHSRYEKERRAIEQLFFIDAFEVSLSLVHEAMSNEASTMTKMTSFIDKLKSDMDLNVGGCSHFIGGIEQLFSSFSAYHPNDITGWIKGMRTQLETTLSRVQVITDVALSEDEIKRIFELTSDNLRWQAQPFFVNKSDLPTAWEIRCVKS